MANVIYPRFKQALLSPGVNLATATVVAVLIDTDQYTYSATHEFLTSVPAGARVGAPQTLANKTVTNGVFDADAVTFPDVTAGPAVEAILIYINTGTAGTSRLIAFIDDATGLPVTPNGGPIEIDWDADGIIIL